LYRYLVGRGIVCEVVAPGLLPARPDDRVKTDSRDARKLARLCAGGLLEAIYVPSPELEAARDLIRAREDARLERMAARHRLSKMLLRNSRRCPERAGGVTRRRWLSEQRFPFPAQQLAFDHYPHASTSSTRASSRSRKRSRLADAGAVGSVGRQAPCLRGVESLTALGIAVEIERHGLASRKCDQ
jgi:transposase